MISGAFTHCASSASNLKVLNLAIEAPEYLPTPSTSSTNSNGEFGVMPSAEYDGDPAAIVHEFDPFQP
jgi:hypothetical protein